MNLTDKCKLIAEAIATRRSVWADGVMYSVESLSWIPGSVRVRLIDSDRVAREVALECIEPDFYPTINKCPFCGGAGKIEQGSYANQWLATCIHCNTKTKAYSSLEESLSAWNRRA